MSKNQQSFYKFSNPITGTIATSLKISPSSEYIAVANGVKLNIYNSHSGKLLQSYPCLDKIDFCSFSCDSDKILCFLKERNVVQAFSVSDKEWKCRINEGSPGIINAYWSSNGYYIITESDFGIQLVIWSLLASQSVSKFIISSPKPNLWNMSKDSFWSPSLTAFSSSKIRNAVISTNKISNKSNNNNNNQHPSESSFHHNNTMDDHNNNYTVAMTENLLASNLFAVVHRFELHDYIAVYSCQDTYTNTNNKTDSSNWEELSKFQCRSNDVACIQWLPHKALILAIDSPLSYNVALYTPGGEVIGMYSAYQHSLGIRSVAAFTQYPTAYPLRPTESSSFSSNTATHSMNMNMNVTDATIPHNSIMHYNQHPSLSSSSSQPPLQQILSQQLIAVGSYDGKIRLLSCHSVQEVFVLNLQHPKDMEAGLVKTSLYTTMLSTTDSTATTATTSTTTSRNSVMNEENGNLALNSKFTSNQDGIVTDGAIFVETHDIHTATAVTSTGTTTGTHNNNSGFLMNNNNNNTSRRHLQQQYSSSSSSLNFIDHSNVENTSYSQHNSNTGAALRRRLAETTTASATAGTGAMNMSAMESYSSQYLSKPRSIKEDGVEENSMFTIQNSLRSLPRVTLVDPRDPKQALKMGVTWQAWSADGEYLAAREETQPRCLWLFSIKSSSSSSSASNSVGNNMTSTTTITNSNGNNRGGSNNNHTNGVKFHHVFVTLHTILCAQWRPNPHATTSAVSTDTSQSHNSIVVLPLLAFCTGTSRVYFWNPYDNDSYPYYEDVPITSVNNTGTTINSNNGGGGGSSLHQSMLNVSGKSNNVMNGVFRLEWSHDGTFLTLFGKDSFIICHVDI